MQRHTILIPDAHAMGSLACIRSLGRAGHRIVASSTSASAIGLQSTFVSVAALQQPYTSLESFLPWLDDLIERERVEIIIPTEGFLLAIMGCLDLYKSKLPGTKFNDGFYRAFSKFDLFETFLGPGAPFEMRRHLPPTALIDDANQSLAALEGGQGPFYLKADSRYARSAPDSLVMPIRDIEGVRKALPEQLARYSKFIIQSHVAGQGVGVFFLRWGGKIRAQFMHRRLHEVPLEGGVSSLRESWWNNDIFQDALARVHFLDWEGVCMFEYRWDEETKTFSLLELNARFWGSLHLPIYAGVDFPALLVAARDGEDFPVPEVPLGVRCRNTFPKEVEYLRCCIKSKELSVWQKAWSLLEFALLSLNPKVKSDLLFPGDRRIFLRSISDTIKKFLS